MFSKILMLLIFFFWFLVSKYLRIFSNVFWTDSYLATETVYCRNWTWPHYYQNWNAFSRSLPPTIHWVFRWHTNCPIMSHSLWPIYDRTDYILRPQGPEGHEFQVLNFMIQTEQITLRHLENPFETFNILHWCDSKIDGGAAMLSVSKRPVGAIKSLSASKNN